MSFKSIIDSTKKVSSLVSLIVCSVFNNSLNGGKPYLLSILMKYDKGRDDSKIMFIGPS